MKTESREDYTWDDVIFENRNKNYGAYVVRQSYSRNTMIAFGMSVSFVIALIVLPQIISAITGVEVKLPDVVKPKRKITELSIRPVVIEELKPKVTAVKSIKRLTPQVVTQEVETVIPTNSEVVTTTSSEGDVEYIIDEPITGVVDEPVPVVDNTPRTFVEVMPKYKGGQEAMMKFISKGVKYPRSASVSGTEGTVFVSFVIDALGRVIDVKVVKGVSADCDKEAMRIISKMTEWEAGIQNKIPVPVRMVVPIKFQINS